MKRYFQWIDGEDIGQVEVLDKIRFEKGEYFYEFVSGESMNSRYIAAQTNLSENLKGMALVEIHDPYDKWKVEEVKPRIETVLDANGAEITVEVPSLDDYVNADNTGNIENSSVGKFKLFPPRFRGPFMPLPDPAEYSQEIKVENLKEVKENLENSVSSFIASPVVESNEEKAPKKIVNPKVSRNETDPVYILVNSAAKEEKSVDMTLKLNLPSRDLYKIVKTQFENGRDKFIECITDILSESLTSEKVLNDLKESIIQAYDNE